MKAFFLDLKKSINHFVATNKPEMNKHNKFNKYGVKTINSKHIFSDDESNDENSDEESNNETPVLVVPQQSRFRRFVSRFPKFPSLRRTSKHKIHPVKTEKKKFNDIGLGGTRKPFKRNKTRKLRRKHRK